MHDNYGTMNFIKAAFEKRIKFKLLMMEADPIPGEKVEERTGRYKACAEEIAEMERRLALVNVALSEGKLNFVPENVLPFPIPKSTDWR